AQHQVQRASKAPRLKACDTSRSEEQREIPVWPLSYSHWINKDWPPAKLHRGLWDQPILRVREQPAGQFDRPILYRPSRGQANNRSDENLVLVRLDNFPPLPAIEVPKQNIVLCDIDIQHSRVLAVLQVAD